LQKWGVSDYNVGMKVNTTTNLGIYLGTGIGQFPTMHCFQRNNGRSYRNCTSEAKEISLDELNAKQKSLSDSMEKFFNASPSISLD